MKERIGQQLGNYRLIDFIGQGGFAEVYLGEHFYLKTQAAIKVLHTRLENKDREGFFSEARTIAHLQHDHIVRVLEFGMENSTPFLVMEYAPNGNLRQRHPRGSHLPLESILPYVKQVAAALQYAHDAKLIHRDIKPENMLLGSNEEVLLSDFGLALVVKSSRYHNAQEVAGTVAYMAPEQLQGETCPASDQYALGITVYEWLCGERPFQGSFLEIASQHLLAPPRPLHEKIPTILPSIEEVVLTALAKDSQQRFNSIQEFAATLEQVSQSNLSTPVEKSLTIQPQSPLFEIDKDRPKQPSSDPGLDAQNAPQAVPQLQSLSRLAQERTVSKGSKIILIVLAVLIIGGSGLIYYIAAFSHAKSSDQTKAQTSSSFQDIYLNATSGTPVIDDSLRTESNINWSATGLCTLMGGALHANKLRNDTGGEAFCYSPYTNFSNFAFQVEMTIIKGDVGGLLFRYDFSHGRGYSFIITTYSHYELSINSGSAKGTSFKRGPNSAIKFGRNQPNLLTVVANGSNIYLYVNRKYVTGVNDTTSTDGTIGVFAVDLKKQAVDVVFRHAQVWVLQ